jgi:hypothetical protein
LRPLSPSQVGLAEHQIRHHVITLSLTQCFEDCLRPEFWANITDRLRVCDKVDVFNARNDFYAELIIRSVTPSSSVRGTKGGARVHVLRYVEFEPLERKAKAIEYTVEFRGPASLWCAIRASDGAIVKSHMDSRELAERHVVSMSAATL